MKHWWERRTVRDGPDDLGFRGLNPEDDLKRAWARGWNMAVEAYESELKENLEKEGVEVQ